MQGTRNLSCCLHADRGPSLDLRVRSEPAPLFCPCPRYPRARLKASCKAWTHLPHLDPQTRASRACRSTSAGISAAFRCRPHPLETGRKATSGPRAAAGPEGTQARSQCTKTRHRMAATRGEESIKHAGGSYTDQKLQQSASQSAGSASLIGACMH